MTDEARLWEFDHARPCSYEEWKHWQFRPMPMGWNFVYTPESFFGKLSEGEQERQ